MNDLISSFKGKKLLVTGATGYLATSLVSQLCDIDCSIIRLSRPGASFPSIVGKARIQDVEGDIREPEIWESILANVDIVFHFAAQTSVYVAEENPLADMKNNVLPMIHLLETCRKQKLNLIVVFAGTVTEAGLPDSLPVDETPPDHPITVYDFHKLMAENYLKYYVRAGVVQGVTLRLANVYGPGRASSSVDRGVLNIMIRKALNGESINIYGKGDFLRDYIYIEDVVNAFLYAAVKIDSINGKKFLIGSGVGHTIANAFSLIADRVALNTGKRVMVTHIGMPESLSPIETRNFVANTRQFFEFTGWIAMYSLVEGVDRTIENFIFSS